MVDEIDQTEDMAESQSGDESPPEKEEPEVGEPGASRGAHRNPAA